MQTGPVSTSSTLPSGESASNRPSIRFEEREVVVWRAARVRVGIVRVAATKGFSETQRARRA